MPKKLSEDAVTTALQGSQWTRDGDAIVRDHRFADFAAAMAFVNRVAEVAEEADHRPDILVDGANNVRLTLSTQAAGGLTRADLELAERLEQVPTG